MSRKMTPPALKAQPRARARILKALQHPTHGCAHQGPVSPPSAAYVTLTNCSGADDALVGAAFAAAAAAELHVTAMSSEGVASMTPGKTLPIVAGDTITLAPGGAHIMLIGLADAVAVGGAPAMTLEFENAPPITVTFDVRDAVHDDHSAH